MTHTSVGPTAAYWDICYQIWNVRSLSVQIFWFIQGGHMSQCPIAGDTTTRAYNASLG